jgi:hypothetical protein
MAEGREYISNLSVALLALIPFDCAQGTGEGKSKSLSLIGRGIRMRVKVEGVLVAKLRYAQID